MVTLRTLGFLPQKERTNALSGKKKSAFAIQFNSIQFLLFTLYKIFILYIVRQEYTNKGKEEGKKRKLMVWVEVYGGQGSLAFELTTANKQEAREVQRKEL